MRIPLYKIYWDEADVNDVAEIIKRGMFWTGGKEINKFEESISKYVGAKYALSFNSGTSALHATLLALGIGENDEVIVPSFSFISTANSALFVGAKPVFADIEDETYGLDAEDVKEKITNKTKAVIAIHYGGLPCHIRELSEVAEDHNLLLIEDAAESLGAHITGKKVGSFGDAAIFSFTGNKVITTGEGGMVVTDSRDIYERLRLIGSHGRLETANYFKSEKLMDYIALGYNWRISTITAALGLSQFRKLDTVIEMRRKNAEYLTKGLSRIGNITPPFVPRGYHHIYQMYTVKVDEGRDELRNHLTEKGITTKVYFDPIHLTSFYRKEFGYEAGELPVTEKLSGQVLTLPMYPTLTVEEMNYMLESIEEAMEMEA